jgi:fructokinase
MNKSASLYGGIEAGGTKFVCMVGSGPENILARTQFSTTNPQETISRAVSFFQEVKVPVKAVGIASFGPLELDKKSATFGSITTTPKPGWANTNIVKILNEALKIPVVIDTDVNGAAMGEWRWGKAQGLDTFIYLTIGTGIGGGGMINGKLMHGLNHPEMGHILIPHDLHKDPFPGCCPYHGDCLEGLASGVAIAKRWGVPPESLPANHEAWQLESAYLSRAVMNYILTFSPQKVIIGGGIMKVSGLLEKIRTTVKTLLNSYINVPVINDRIDEYIVTPGLKDLAGVLGAIALAEEEA